MDIKTHQLKIACDMKDTLLCMRYQKRMERGQRCNYGFSHGITNCPYDTSNLDTDSNEKENQV